MKTPSIFINPGFYGLDHNFEFKSAQWHCKYFRDLLGEAMTRLNEHVHIETIDLSPELKSWWKQNEKDLMKDKRQAALNKLTPFERKLLGLEKE